MPIIRGEGPLGLILTPSVRHFFYYKNYFSMNWQFNIMNL